MSHKVAHTVLRRGAYYYNRRVPQRVREAFGRDAVRLNLGTDPDRASRMAGMLTERLDDLWKSDRLKPVSLDQLVRSLEPSALDLLTCTETYLKGRDIAEKPVWPPQA